MAVPSSIEPSMQFEGLSLLRICPPSRFLRGFTVNFIPDSTLLKGFVLMSSNLQNPIFTDETKARGWLEARVWPHGPICPHCGNADQDKITGLKGKAHRPGLYQCAECREQFTVTVKTVFERSKIPLSKWLAALFLLTSSKKCVSAHQIHRSLGISYKSSWFMMHRLREALRTGGLAPLGGSGTVVGADETSI